jgi:hypothetical protein
MAAISQATLADPRRPVWQPEAAGRAQSGTTSESMASASEGPSSSSAPLSTQRPRLRLLRAAPPCGIHRTFTSQWIDTGELRLDAAFGGDGRLAAAGARGDEGPAR